MVNDLIYREDAIKAACAGFCHPGIFCPDTGCKELEPIKNLPAAEEKKGRWILASEYYEAQTCRCSECGKKLTTKIDIRVPFCPWCGARMEGEQDV